MKPILKTAAATLVVLTAFSASGHAQSATGEVRRDPGQQSNKGLAPDSDPAAEKKVPSGSSAGDTTPGSSSTGAGTGSGGTAGGNQQGSFGTQGPSSEAGPGQAPKPTE